jgi:signal transduction histidine kinase
LAVGMRLRSAQRRFSPDEPTHQDLEAAVLALEQTVTELRRLAHGIRPSGLDGGLEHAVRSLVARSPIPVDVSVAKLQMSEAVESTAYFVISEALTNAFKHAAAHSVQVRVAPRDGGVEVEVADDGSGGATEEFGLTGVRDRVVALGGRVSVVSPIGAGTRVRAEL